MPTLLERPLADLWTDAELDELVAALTRRSVVSGGLAAGLLTTLRQQGSAQEATPAVPWTFTDDRGITVTLPQRPRRIAAVVHEAAALWDYGVRPLAVFGPQRQADGSPDPQVGAVDLDAVVSLGETWDDFDVERLLELEADLVVSHYYEDAADLWYLPAEPLREVESRVPTVAFAYMDGPITRTIERLAAFAGALGADLDSPENVAAKESFAEAEAELAAAIAAKPGLTVLCIDPYPENLYVGNPTVATDLIYYRDLGLDIVVPAGDGFFAELSWEQANIYPADLILRDSRSQAATLEELEAIAIWNALPAVKAGQVGLWPIGATLSYTSYAAVLRDLAAVVRQSRADVV